MNSLLTSLLNRSIFAVGLPLLAGTAALALSTALLPAPSAQAQLEAGGCSGRSERVREELNLTPEQQTEADRLRQAQRTQIDAILTTDQKAQLEAALANGERPRQAFESLNLTAAQRSQIQAVHESGRQQFEALLTPAQRQQLEQHRQNRPQRPQ